MTDHIEKSAREAAADMLENTLHRINYTVNTRDAVADHFIAFLARVTRPAKRGYQAEAEAKVANVLSLGPNVAKNIAVATRLNVEAVQPALRRMVKKGVVEVIGKADRAKIYKLVKK